MRLAAVRECSGVLNIRPSRPRKPTTVHMVFLTDLEARVIVAGLADTKAQAVRDAAAVLAGQTGQSFDECDPHGIPRPGAS